MRCFPSAWVDGGGVINKATGDQTLACHLRQEAGAHSRGDKAEDIWKSGSQSEEFPTLNTVHPQKAPSVQRPQLPGPHVSLFLIAGFVFRTGETMQISRN